MFKKIDRQKAAEFLVLSLLVFSSGNPFFRAYDMTILIPCMVIATVIFYQRKLGMDKFLIYVIVVFLVVQMGQMLKFHLLPISTFMGLYIRILFAYFTIRILGRKFTGYYVQLLYVLSIISFVFFVPSLIIPGFEKFLLSNVVPLFRPGVVGNSVSYAPNFIIHVFQPGYNYVRNCGPFWEPGVFAGFLIIALIFHIIEKKTVNDRKGRVLLLALISTLSTTGLVALAYFLIAFVVKKVQPIYRIIMVPIFIVVIVVSFTQMDFLGNKITNQFDYSTSYTNTRFKSAYLDLQDLAENPILGLGRNSQTRYKGLTDHRLTHRNNGITDYLVTYGIFIFFMYFGFMYYSFYRFCNVNNYPAIFGLHCLILIFLIGFSEGYFGLPFFYALTLLHLSYREPVGVSPPVEVSTV